MMSLSQSHHHLSYCMLLPGHDWTAWQAPLAISCVPCMAPCHRSPESCRAVAYEPPSEELTEALIVLARYVTTTEHPSSKEQPFRPAQVLPWLPVPPAQPALSAWSSGASCAPASLGPAGEPAAQVGTRCSYETVV